MSEGDHLYTRTPPDHVRDAYKRVERYLIDNGVNPANERLKAYRNFLAADSGQPHDPLEPLEAMRLWREVHEVTWVITTLAQNDAIVPKPLLVRAFDGNPLDDYISEPGRNYFLQLRAAIYFLLAGYQVAIDGDCDVIAERRRTRIFVECKRLYSKAKARQRTRECIEQLETRLATAPRWRRNLGFAWLDPSPAMQQRYFAYSAYSVRGALAAARTDLQEFWNEFLARSYDGRERRIAGLVLQLVWPSWIDHAGGVHTGFSTVVFPASPKITFFGMREAHRIISELVRFEDPKR